MFAIKVPFGLAMIDCTALGGVSGWRMFATGLSSARISGHGSGRIARVWISARGSAWVTGCGIPAWLSVEAMFGLAMFSGAVFGRATIDCAPLGGMSGQRTCAARLSAAWISARGSG
jgi:hypothetical protein